MSAETVRFGLLCSMFQAMLRDRTSVKKRRRLRTFLDRVYTGGEYFSAIRLILPSLDRERGTYGLKESALAACLVEALGISKDSEDALRLINWRKGGARTGANAGNFAVVASEVLQRRQGLASGGLTIKEVNDALDELTRKESRSEKASVLSHLITKTNAIEMKWILMIILKDLKLGISEKSIFNEFHPDAEDLFNVTCDLKLVCEKLNDRTQRHKRQDIEVGKAVRPQLALRVNDAATAWKKLHGKQVVIECKFDGDRIQIHKNGVNINYFSRNFLDHGEYSHGMSDLIRENILVDRCILDGEMLVWDTSTQRFAQFGSNQEIAKAAREGMQSDRQLCYVAFDVLYAGDTSVIHQSLSERHEILQKVVKPVKGRLEILIPFGGINNYRSPGEPSWSIVANSLEDVERFFKQTIENRDEGIVVKDLGSKWDPSDRSGKWLKLKPDYIHAGADLDVLIIGGYFGSGRRGGEVAQFLVGLAEPSPPGTHPKKFISFCRVGTGLSDDELDSLVAKLKPYFRKNEWPKKAPRIYEVTNNSKERPDVWIERPDKSVVVSITSDIRTIKSEVFSAPYSLRFPRIHRVRYDKPWHECLDVQSFIDLVNSSNGNVHRGTEHAGAQDQSSKQRNPSQKGQKRNLHSVPSHFIQTDISDVKGKSTIFSNMMFYFANAPSSYSIDHFHKLVAEHGGNFSMNLNDSVTHCIAAEKKGIKYQSATRHGDVIHYSWILDCCSKNALVHLQPKYFLFLTDSSKHKFQEEMDAYSDYYFWDLDQSDIKQIFENMSVSKEPKEIGHYRRKYCALESLCLFDDCRIRFVKASPVEYADFNDLGDISLRRMALEVALRGGEIVNSLVAATHVVAYSPLDSIKDFGTIYKSFPSSERRFLHAKSLHFVKHLWLEESLEKGKRLPEDAYNMWPVNSDLEMSESGISGKDWHHQGTIDEDKQEGATVLNQSGQRKKGQNATLLQGKGKADKTLSKRTRARTGHRPAKIQHESEASGSEESLERSGDPPNEQKISQPVSQERGQADKKLSRRTRARTGHRPAKIQHESEASGSEESLESGGDPPNKLKVSKPVSPPERAKSKLASRQRATSRNKLPKQNQLNLDDSTPAEEDFKLMPQSKLQHHHPDLDVSPEILSKHSIGLHEKRESSVQAEHTEPGYKNRRSFDTHHSGPGATLEESKDENDMKGGHTTSDIRSSSSFDPVQAMLIDMIPSLSQKKSDPGKLPDHDEGQHQTESKPAKKKVSYKDLAFELLKD